MHYFNFNGNLLTEGTAIFPASNSALKFGDGLFETIKFANGNIILLNEHLNRLWKGLHTLQMSIPPQFTYTYIEEEIKRLLQKNNIHYGRIRLTLLRNEQPKTENTPIHFIIECWSVPKPNSGLNEVGYTIGLFKEAKKSIDHFSNLKHNNFLPYFMGSRYAKANGFNDVIIINQKNEICDSSVANIFIVKNEEIFTVALSEGCIEGTIRNFILKHAADFGYLITEKNITVDELRNADEIFLTNAIVNIKWVEKFETNIFSNTLTKKLVQDFENAFPLVFC